MIESVYEGLLDILFLVRIVCFTVILSFYIKLRERNHLYMTIGWLMWTISPLLRTFDHDSNVFQSMLSGILAALGTYYMIIGVILYFTKLKEWLFHLIGLIIIIVPLVQYMIDSSSEIIVIVVFQFLSVQLIFLYVLIRIKNFIKVGGDSSIWLIMLIIIGTYQSAMYILSPEYPQSLQFFGLNYAIAILFTIYITAFEHHISQNKLRLANERSIRLREHLNQTQRFESIVQFTGGIAHNFNNILTTIRGASELCLLQKGEWDEEFVKTQLKSILASSERASTLISQLLNISKQQISDARVINPSKNIKSIINMVEKLTSSDIELKVELKETSNISIDPVQLEQIILNLVSNANEAIKTKNREPKRVSIVLQDYIPNDTTNKVLPLEKYVQFTISDTGIGIKEKHIAQLFTPFFSTKAKGTGLGLYTVYNLVKQNNAEIIVQSEEGVGTEFELYFPATSQAVIEIDKQYDVTDYHGEGLIVYAEDEIELNQQVSKFLKGLGYTVIASTNGMDAFNQSLDMKIDILVTDITMPGMNGIELYEKICEVSGNIPTIFLTGYVDKEDQLIDLMNRNTNVIYMKKPFGFQELAYVIHTFLSD